MAKFEHARYPAVTFQDDKGVWAQFTPEAREFGEHKIEVGVLETSDAALIKRLREAVKTDEHLTEVHGKAAKPGDSE